MRAKKGFFKFVNQKLHLPVESALEFRGLINWIREYLQVDDIPIIAANLKIKKSRFIYRDFL